MTMEGMMQKHFQHRIPKGGCVEPRINLTWTLGCTSLCFCFDSWYVQIVSSLHHYPILIPSHVHLFHVVSFISFDWHQALDSQALSRVSCESPTVMTAILAVKKVVFGISESCEEDAPDMLVQNSCNWNMAQDGNTSFDSGLWIFVWIHDYFSWFFCLEWEWCFFFWFRFNDKSHLGSQHIPIRTSRRRRLLAAKKGHDWRPKDLRKHMAFQDFRAKNHEMLPKSCDMNFDRKHSRNLTEIS